LRALKIKNFAQIATVDLAFGDLTVLVGAQGTGKSLTLQWLKAAIDGKAIIQTLRQAGHDTATPGALLDLIFGVGMGPAWNASTSVTFGRKAVTPDNVGRLGGATENAFFIPAHRAMLISDGWAQPFQKLTPDTPVVARIFSQNLFERFSQRQAGTLFPVERMLKKCYREHIDKAIYHGGDVSLELDAQHARRLRLSHGGASLPFMTWTAGQREFTPLLLGLYHLLPRTQVTKREDIDWVIIEEPEMGLHPQAVNVVLMLVLDLLWRGYRVVLSTHSPHVLTAVWMLRRLAEHGAGADSLARAFGIDASDFRRVAEAAIGKSYRTFSFAYTGTGAVASTDISELDPGAEDEIQAGWGGLTGFSSSFGEAVRAAVNEANR